MGPAPAETVIVTFDAAVSARSCGPSWATLSATDIWPKQKDKSV